MIVVEIKATTVAATMRLAHKSGITTFVTGEALREVIRFSIHGDLSFYLINQSYYIIQAALAEYIGVESCR